MFFFINSPVNVQTMREGGWLRNYNIKEHKSGKSAFFCVLHKIFVPHDWTEVSEVRFA